MTFLRFFTAGKRWWLVLLGVHMAIACYVAILMLCRTCRTTGKQESPSRANAECNEDESLLLLQQRSLLSFEPDRKGVLIQYVNKSHRENAKRSCTKAKVVFANYGSHGLYLVRQNESCQTALRWGADACVSFRAEFLDETFKAVNQKLLSKRRLGGYAVWKPYIIFHTLLAMQPDDILFYLDVDWNVISPIDDYICFMEQLKQEIVTFSQEFTEWEWTKQDAIILMNMEGHPEYLDSLQLRSGYLFLKRTPRTIRFISEWLTYNQDSRIVNDEPGVLQTKEVPGFKENRHDQTVLSLLAKKWNLTIWPELRQKFNKRFSKYRINDKIYTVDHAVDTELPGHPVQALIRDVHWDFTNR